MDHLIPAAPAARLPPTVEQRRAADPDCSIWVTASAGTGKTRVLADRVMRLLLAGIDPRQILCLTFTKAAAAEMVKRVEEDLSRFAVLPEAALATELEGLLGRSPTAAERARARTLLTRVLDLPAGLPIMTIHGFCQSLLKRFPLEAGVVPHFDVLDPRSAADLLREAQAEILADARGEIRLALNRLAVLLGETTLAEGLAALREARLRLGALLAAHDGAVERLIAEVYGTLDLAPGASPEEVRRDRLRRCCDRSTRAAGRRAGARRRQRNRGGARAGDRRLAGGGRGRARAAVAGLRIRLPDDQTRAANRPAR